MAALFYGGEAAEPIAAIIAHHLAAPRPAVPLDTTTTVEALLAAAAATANADAGDDPSELPLVLVLECDREGDCAPARRLLRALKKAEPNLLSGRPFAVLAIARSVCSFSAASGGADKYEAGAKAVAALKRLGGRPLAPMGAAEVEVEEVGAAVLPWVRQLAGALGGAADAASSAPVQILHSGDLAQEIAALAQQRLGCDAMLVDMSRFDTWADEVSLHNLDAPLDVILVVATIENEEPPEPAGKCIRYFRRRTHKEDSLGRLRYTVLGLGDSNLLLDRQTTTAADCNQVAQSLDKRLAELGARCFYARGEADDRTGNAEVEPWLAGLASAVERARSGDGDAIGMFAPTDELVAPAAAAAAAVGADTRLSVELFIPRAAAGMEALRTDLVPALASFGPTLVSVSAASGLPSAAPALAALRALGLRAQLQLERHRVQRADVVRLVDDCLAAGVSDLLLLDGPPPASAAAAAPTPSPPTRARQLGFSTVTELLTAIKQSPAGAKLTVAVCGFPRGSDAGGEAGSYEGNLSALRSRIEAGADAVVLAPVFEPAPVASLLSELRGAEACEVRPSLLPLTSRGTFERAIGGLGLKLPPWLRRAVDAAESDADLRAFGDPLVAKLAVGLIEALRAAGRSSPPLLHVCTLNAGSVPATLRGCGFAPLAHRVDGPACVPSSGEARCGSA